MNQTRRQGDNSSTAGIPAVKREGEMGDQSSPNRTESDHDQSKSTSEKDYNSIARNEFICGCTISMIV